MSRSDTPANVGSMEGLGGTFVERFNSLYPELAQLVQGCKQDWTVQGCWSEWDQSVLDRLQALARTGATTEELT